MKKGSEKSIVNWFGHQVLGVFSSILFWFLIVVITYILLIAYNSRDMLYTQREWWGEFYSVSSSFLVGGLISFFFYFLVVFIQEQKKRRIIKASLRKMYADFKHDILYQIIFASQRGGRADLSADNETVERLLTVDGFRAAFKGGRESNEGFYAFLNHISDNAHEYREIILNLQVLSKQIAYVLHNYPITDGEIFDFFKRLEVFLMRLEKIGPGYDEGKVLSQFIWEIFAGWNFIEGYRDYDIIEKMIGDI